MRVCAIIPARMASSRLPNKPLALINGKPMIEHVYKGVLESKLCQKIIIATDDNLIKTTAENFGATVIMTSVNCQTGTDRLVEALGQLEAFDLIVNVQGDEPLISGKIIDLAISELQNNPDSVMSTLASTTIDEDDYINPNKVKVVINKKHEALYFSRASIPFNRDFKNKPQNAFLHIGLYVYKYEFLKNFKLLKLSELEEVEKLEQLRVLDNGYKISVAMTDYKSIGVDVFDDIKEVELILNKR